MQRLMRTLVVAASLLAATSAGAAATLTTAPAYDAVGLLECVVVNASSDVVRLILQARDYDGGVLAAFGPVDLAPNAFTSSAPYKAGAAYCEFQVLEGKPKHIRAAANYRDSNGTLTVVPAR